MTNLIYIFEKRVEAINKCVERIEIRNFHCNYISVIMDLFYHLQKQNREHYNPPPSVTERSNCISVKGSLQLNSQIDLIKPNLVLTKKDFASCVYSERRTFKIALQTGVLDSEERD